MSDEYQKWWVSHEYGVSPLLEESVSAEFGQLSEFAEALNEKNWQALINIPGAPIPRNSPYEQIIREPITIEAYQGLLDGSDINSVLRVMDEQAGNIVAELQGRE